MIGKWFWQPDKNYVNEINTTNLRTISGIRMSVALVTVGIVAFLWFAWHGVPHCAVEPCRKLLATAQAADFAKGMFDTMCLFVGAIMGIALGGYAVKRNTDTGYTERKELAKATRPVVIQPPTNPAPNTQVNVGVEQAPKES